MRIGFAFIAQRLIFDGDKLVATMGKQNGYYAPQGDYICEAVNNYQELKKSVYMLNDSVNFLSKEREALRNSNAELFQMVKDLKNCIQRLTQDNLSQYERDIEAQWEGEAHELLLKINPNYYKNANE